MTDLGRDIPITDGCKPEWLADDEMTAPTYRVGRFAPIEAGKATWLAITAIRLRTDHPFYKQEAIDPYAHADGSRECRPVEAAPSFDTDKYVLVERMTEAEWTRRVDDLRGTEAIWIGAMQLAREQGVIRPGRQTLGQHIAEGCGDD